METSESTVQKLEQEINNNQEAIKEAENAVAKLEDELSALTKKAEELMEGMAAQEAIKNETNSKLDERKNEFNEMKKQL